MKKIILLGDSIRMGYDKYVKDALAGTAEVLYPKENCAFAQNTMRFLHEWRGNGGWGDDADLVHWNNGLWDVGELFEDGPMSTLSHYTDTIRRIDKRIRMLFPKAKVVFATTTAVREEGYTGGFRRYNATIERFNAAALEALAHTDTRINDLYTHTKNVAPECCSDMTHFNTPEGAAYMGKRVLSVICSLLDIRAEEVNLADFRPEQYTAKMIGC